MVAAFPAPAHGAPVVTDWSWRRAERFKVAGRFLAGVSANKSGLTPLTQIFHSSSKSRRDDFFVRHVPGEEPEFAGKLIHAGHE